MFEKITVILKPTNACNLRCKYCYHEEAGYENNRLALENCEKLLRILATKVNEALITWHGGEPMLMGMPYFKAVLELERRIEKENGGRIKFLNCIQTNGTLLDRAWVKFFKENDIQVGVSFDGPHNDVTRGESQRILDNLKLLQKADQTTACLAVISRVNIDQVAVYEFFKARGLHCVFNPIMAEGAGAENPDLMISAEEYIESTLRLFDHWIYDREGVSVSMFELYLSSILGVKRATCGNASCIGKWICMEPDGSLQLCSHFVGEEYSFGNVREYDTLDEVFSSANVRRLLQLSIGKRKLCKESGCPYYPYCHGGCIYANIRQQSLDRIGSFDCQAFRAIFGHVNAFVRQALAENIDINTLNPYARACFLQYISRISDPS